MTARTLPADLPTALGKRIEPPKQVAPAPVLRQVGTTPGIVAGPDAAIVARGVAQMAEYFALQPAMRQTRRWETS